MSLEEQNERLVTQFCRDWANRDAHALAEYLSDDVVYQMYEGHPDIIGPEAFIKTMDSFLKGLKAVEWEIIRSHAIGELVINERIDHFIAHDDKRSNHPVIAGFFLVRDGKIKLWRDYSLPPGISEPGSANPDA